MPTSAFTNQGPTANVTDAASTFILSFSLDKAAFPKAKPDDGGKRGSVFPKARKREGNRPSLLQFFPLRLTAERPQRLSGANPNLSQRQISAGSGENSEAELLEFLSGFGTVAPPIAIIAGGKVDVEAFYDEPEKPFSRQSNSGCVVLWFSPSTEPTFPPANAPWPGTWVRLPNIAAGFVRKDGEEIEMFPLGTAWILFPTTNVNYEGMKCLIFDRRPQKKKAP